MNKQEFLAKAGELCNEFLTSNDLPSAKCMWKVILTGQEYVQLNKSPFLNSFLSREGSHVTNIMGQDSYEVWYMSDTIDMNAIIDLTIIARFAKH